MPSPFTIAPKRGFRGYVSNASNASADFLSKPSQNCLVTDDGKAISRSGYQSEFSIGVSGSAATAFYHKTYDLAFFALGTKVYYRDFTNAVTVDTGIALTAGTTTRFAEFLGDIYLSNTTDGIYVIRCMRLNDAAANSGDGTVTIDMDGASRISVFGDIAAGGSADDLRINGTNEQMASLVVSTGVVTLSGTLSASYADNTIALVVRRYSSLEDPSKILFWKSRMHLMGFPSAANFDQPNNAVSAGQFADQTALETVIDFTYGTGGSTRITVGTGGKLTNILGVKDNIYFFLEDTVHATTSSDVATTGASIGGTTPVIKDELHGCLNEDCATVMGDNAVTYITSDRRFMRIPIDTNTGAALSHPEEDFDVDIRDHLKNMDKTQTGALCYHYRGGRQTIYQVKILGQWYWFIFDHNVIRADGLSRGVWQPPQQITPVKSFFERNGVLYGTDPSTDTVYSFFTTFTDNGVAIYTIIATGEFNVGNAMMQEAQLQGDINQPCEIEIRCWVWNETSGKRSGSAKVINGSSYSYSDDNSVGALPIGDGGVEGETTQIAQWKKSFDIYPSEATRAQLVAENQVDGAYFSISSFQLTGNAFSNTFSKSL